MNNKNEMFWMRFDKSLFNTGMAGFHSDAKGIIFRDIPKADKERQLKMITESYFTQISLRDAEKIPRIRTVSDCSGVSVGMHRHLMSLGINTIVVIGDVVLDGEPQYGTSINSLINELSDNRKEKVSFHVWLMTDSYLLIDPTIRLKHDLHEPFISGGSHGSPYIVDVESMSEREFNSEVRHFPYAA